MTSSTPGIPMKGDTPCPTCGFGKNRDFNFCSNPFHRAAPSEEPTPGDGSWKRLAMQALRYLTADQIAEAAKAAGAEYNICATPKQALNAMALGERIVPIASSAPRAVTAGTPDAEIWDAIDDYVAARYIAEQDEGADSADADRQVERARANLKAAVAHRHAPSNETVERYRSMLRIVAFELENRDTEPDRTQIGDEIRAEYAKELREVDLLLARLRSPGDTPEAPYPDDDHTPGEIAIANYDEYRAALRDAKRWRALAAVAYIESIGPKIDYYVTTSRFLTHDSLAGRIDVEGYADALIARAALPSDSSPDKP